MSELQKEVLVDVSDHAIVRWLERAHGLDVEAIRDHLAGVAERGARMGAAAVRIGRIKLVLSHNGVGPAGEALVTIVTTTPREHVHPRRRRAERREVSD